MYLINYCLKESNLFNLGKFEFAKLHALRAFVPARPCALRACEP